MAIAALFEFPGESVETYDRVLELGGDNLRNQPARSHHVCFEIEDGWTVLDVWDSEEESAKFGEVLGPALQEAGISVQPKTYKVHNTM